jgi:hypothetical protein
LAARSFVRHGYRLLATRPDRDDTDWPLLHELGVSWVAPAVPVLASRHDWDRGTTTIPSFLGHKDVTRRSELPDRLNHPYHQLRSGSSREVMSASMKQCRQSA